MSELELYKFLEEHEIEYRWERQNTEFLVWIPFYLLEDFTEMIGEDYFCEGGVDVNLQYSWVCIDITNIAECHSIDLENILKKEAD